MKRVMFLMLLVLSQLTIIAHEGKHEKKIAKQDTLTIVGKDTIAVNGISKNLYKKKIELESIKEEPAKLNPSEEIFKHMHNKLVHFPIALGVFAFFLTLLNFKWKNLDAAILITILVALLFSIAAFITGKNQSTSFIGTSKEWIVELHQNIGIAILINFFIWTIVLIIDKLNKYAWVIGLIAFHLILVAGFLGGVIAH